MDIEWWKDKISEDIYETLRTKEQHLPPYHGHSPQQWFRRHLVDWLAIVVETFYLGTTSQHLAVHLLDFFMDKLEVDQNHLYLLAMACLSISGMNIYLTKYGGSQARLIKEKKWLWFWFWFIKFFLNTFLKKMKMSWRFSNVFLSAMHAYCKATFYKMYFNCKNC